jgi:hypothetical protein
METKKVVLVLRADLARCLGRDHRSAVLAAIEPVAFLKKGTEELPLFDVNALRTDRLVDFAALQQVHGLGRVALSRKLEARYGKDWQAKFNKRQLAAAQTGEVK